MGNPVLPRRAGSSMGRVRIQWLCLERMCDSAIPISQGHIYFVRGKLPNIWGLNSSKEIPKRLVAQTPNIGSRLCPVEFFLRYGLSKRLWPSSYTPLGCDQSQVLWAWSVYIARSGCEMGRSEFLGPLPPTGTTLPFFHVPV